MCGICAVHAPGAVDRERLERMTDALAHRGPDGRGTLVRGRCGLGHRRLSIIDPVSSAQPMSAANGELAITFNGEIYNYRALRRELEGEFAFRTNGDTEVLLNLYLRDGERCVERLRGMFAFVIHDRRDDSLFAARDHFGQKPLYYAHEGERLLVASEIKALLEADGALREMDEAALHEYMTLRVITAPRSMFRRIRKLPPGHRLSFAGGRLSIERYWSLSYERKVSASFDEAIEGIGQQLDETVRCHLEADVPVGAFLSGGLDSSLVAEAVRRVTGEPFPTFAGGIGDAVHSELEPARLVANALGTRHHETVIEPSFVGSLVEMVTAMDEPSDMLSPCIFQISALARRHVKVVLGGDGGDELFGGYDRYFGNRFASAYALLPRAARRLLLERLSGWVPEGGWYRSLGHQLRWLDEMAMHRGGQRYARSLSYFYFSADRSERLYTEGFARRAHAFDPEAHVAAHFDGAPASSLLERMLSSDSATRLPDHPVMILDRMSMAHGLEARSPFLDHRLAEFCAALPARYKVRGSRLRIAQRELARRRLPEQVSGRSKQGFASPLAYVFGREFRSLYERLLRRSTLAGSDVFRQDEIDRLANAHLDGDADHGQRLWQLINAEVWYRLKVLGEDRLTLQSRLDGRSADAA